MRLLLPLVLTQELLSILFCFIQDVSDKNVMILEILIQVNITSTFPGEVSELEIV